MIRSKDGDKEGGRAEEQEGRGGSERDIVVGRGAGEADRARGGRIDGGILSGDGKGGFATPVYFLLMLGRPSLAVADLDGNGKPDLVTPGGILFDRRSR